MNAHKSIAPIFITIVCAANMPAASAQDLSGPAYQWSSSPWNIRYVLFVNTVKGMRLDAERAEVFNRQDNKQENHVYLEAAELLTPTAIFTVPGTEPLATFLVSFDANGRVVTDSPEKSLFTGKRTGYDRLVLLRNDIPGAKPYEFADWTQHIPGDATASPPLCIDLDLERYSEKWKRGTAAGDFGCREWTASLYRWQQQYIDVTTYTRHGNFIGKFMGWSRFSDPRKPVIGMHGKLWFCLYDCPDGEAPGAIPDIRYWVQIHHLPVPTRPAHQPEYPDAMYKDYRWEVKD